MKKIVGVLRPFDLYQTIYIYEDGNQIDAFESTIDDLPNNILKSANQHNIDQIDFSGPTHYIKGIIKMIQKKEIEQYSKNILNFTCI